METSDLMASELKYQEGIDEAARLISYLALSANEDILNGDHCVYSGETLNEVSASRFNTRYLRLQQGETILIQIGPKQSVFTRSSGIAITTRGVHIKWVDSLVLSAYNFYPYRSIKSLSLGGSDFMDGQMYVGDEIVINDHTIGKVRISKGFTLDQPAQHVTSKLFWLINGVDFNDDAIGTEEWS
jgi:hypothetical protein